MEERKIMDIDLPKNTPYEYGQVLKEFKSNNYKNKMCNSIDDLKSAVKGKRIFIFTGEIRDADYSSIKLGRVYLIIVAVLAVLLFVFGDISNPMFILLGLMPLFSMGIIAFGYYKNGKDNILGKPSWFMIVGPKGLLFNVKNMENAVFMEWYDITKIGSRVKRKHKIVVDTLGINFAYKNMIEYSIDFYHFNLKDLGDKGRSLLLELMKLYKESFTR